MTDKQLIEVFGDMRGLIDHDPAECGACCQRSIDAAVAQEFLARGDFRFAECAAESRKRWEQTKFYKLWQQETEAGRDPKAAFAAEGWIA